MLATVLIVLGAGGYLLLPSPKPSSAPTGMLYGTVVTTGSATTPGSVRLAGGRVVPAQVVPPPGTAGDQPPSLILRFHAGDRVVVAYTAGPKGSPQYAVADFQRGPALLALIALFLVVVVLVGRAQGLRAVLGTAASLVLVLVAVIPAILHGANPVLAVLLGSGGVLGFTMYFVHGVNWKTTAALAGTVATVLLALLTADVFLHAAHVISFGDEDSTFIAIGAPQVSLQGLVLAAVVIGALGALVDVTIGQASTVSELAHLGPHLGVRELYGRAMHVGLDHIGSLINTLVLAYVSSALPLIMLIAMDNVGVRQELTLQLVAVQLIHTLVGAIALVLAVPLTTLIAAWFFRGGRFWDPRGGHTHSHAHHHG